jgi:hypothetical protein
MTTAIFIWLSLLKSLTAGREFYPERNKIVLFLKRHVFLLQFGAITSVNIIGNNSTRDIFLRGKRKGLYVLRWNPHYRDDACFNPSFGDVIFGDEIPNILFQSCQQATFFRPGLACCLAWYDLRCLQARPKIKDRPAAWPGLTCRPNQAEWCWWFFKFIILYNSLFTYWVNSIDLFSVICLISFHKITK